MIVGIDAKELSKGRAGIAVYIRSMLDWFHKLENENQYILFSGSDFDLDPSWTRCQKVIYKVHTTGSIEIAYRLNSLIEKYNVDLFWGPEHCIPLKKGTFRKVVTIHDIAVIINPAWGTTYNAILQKFLVKRSLKAADKVVSISESTKQDLIKRFRTCEDKIKVIYNGDSPYNYELRDYSDEAEREIRLKFKIPDKYFLFCGTIEPRKNIISILEAFENFSEGAFEKYKLVLAGGLGWKYEPIIKRINSSPKVDRIILTGYVTEEEKEFLYRNAEALVFPSFYEGLGFPVIEALSVGTSVITARNSSLPEVGGKVALYVDPADDVAGIEKYMRKVAGSTDKEKAVKRENNIAWSKHFSRRKCAEDILGLFNELNQSR